MVLLKKRSAQAMALEEGDLMECLRTAAAGVARA